MKTINIMLGHGDRRMSHLLEARIRDMAYGQAMVNLVRAARIDEFVRQASCKGFDLIIAAPDDLLPCASQRSSCISTQDAVHAITAIRRRHSTPILAIGVPEKDRMALLEAGVDNTLGLPMNLEQFREEVRMTLRLSARTEESPARWEWVGFLLRGFQRQ